ncbi:MAG: hypothetical protein A2509_10930 [Candidatus Edwardsbacteria bacterium RIFOXYD12_FULL_50_11]|nr:MAG: hypothetical protein A2509_10930 [Candidatus Edwardsbacteria bacterium RIFOXYD12_FULL_50_11]
MDTFLRRLPFWRQYALLGLLLYAPAVFFKYTYFDDYTLIVQDAGFISNAHNVLKIFSSDVFRAETVAYRPFLTLSLMIDARIGGTSPWIYHLSNIIIHLTAACLLFFFLKKSEVGAGLATLLSIFFLVHPALVPAVAWIPGRNDSLLGLAVLLWLISLYKITQTGSRGWLFIHLTFYLSALFIKEAALVLPAVGLVYMMFYRAGDLSRQSRCALMIGWGGISVFWFVLRNSAIGGSNESGRMIFNSFWENVQGLLGYLGKILLPFNLSVIPIPGINMVLYGAVVVIIIIAAIAARGLKNKGLFYTGASILVLFLLPHLLRGAEFVNFLEHRLYVPLLGFVLMLSQMNVLGEINWRKTANFAAAAIILGVFAALSIIRLPIYYDHNSLLLNLIEKTPGLALSYQHLGYIFTESGQYNKAQLYYQKALTLEPKNKNIFHGLGVVYESQGNWEKAEDSFKKGLELAPRSSSLRYNLAYLYHQRGDTAGAERQYKLAILSRPENIRAQLNLGMLYHQQGKLQQAERQYKRVLSIDGKASQALFNLGILFRQTGRRDSSENYLKRAAGENPELEKHMP